MSENKHVFKIVPGKPFDYKGELKTFKDEKSSNMLVPDNLLNKPYKLANVAFIPLDDESDKVLKLSLKFCGSCELGKRKDVFACYGENLNYVQTYRCELKEEPDVYETYCWVHNYSRRSEEDYINYRNSFIYLSNRLMSMSVKCEGSGSYTLYCAVQPAEYQYITRDESGTYYFLDREGNIIDSPDNKVLQKSLAPCSREEAEEIIINNILSNIPDDVLSSNAFIKFLVKGLSDEQLKTFTNTINDKQLQAIAKYLTDDQLQALVDHLTNHQLETLAQELNETKLKIIVPTLNEDQLGNLVKELEPDQVKNLLPHLKMDQFKAFITSLDSEKFTVIVKDLAEHHLTILSKELGVDQLRALVSSLQEDQLKDLVNKLDDRQLIAIAQDLTDPSRIKVIIGSLIDPKKLQILAQNMSDEQFAKLLNELSSKDLKDIIHKLPYEKVISVVGQSGDKSQLDHIVRILEEKLEEQKNYIKNLLGDDGSIVDPNNPNEFSYLYYHPVVEI